MTGSDDIGKLPFHAAENDEAGHKDNDRGGAGISAGAQADSAMAEQRHPESFDERCERIQLVEETRKTGWNDQNRVTDRAAIEQELQGHGQDVQDVAISDGERRADEAKTGGEQQQEDQPEREEEQRGTGHSARGQEQNTTDHERDGEIEQRGQHTGERQEQPRKEDLGNGLQSVRMDCAGP